METGENKIIKSSEFDIALSEQYHLSLQIGVNIFSFCILDISKLHYQYISTYQFQYTSIDEMIQKITKIINENDMLKTNFSSSSLIYSGFPSTLIPDKINIIGKEKEILEFQNNVFEIIYKDHIAESNINLIYSIPAGIENITNTFFPGIKYMSEEKVLIQQNLMKNSKPTIYLNFSNKRFTNTVIEKNQLLLQNSFNFNTKEDMLYYILFCMEQLSLSTETTNIVLYGNINKKDEKYKLLYEYIRNISFGEITNSLTINIASKIQTHNYFSLLSQILCV